MKNLLFHYLEVETTNTVWKREEETRYAKPSMFSLQFDLGYRS